MHLQWLDETDLNTWDALQMESPRGHYCQLSTWLRSFRSYGGKEKIVAVKDETGAILGGLGCISWRKWGLEFWVAPAGPVVREGSEELAPVVLDAVSTAARDSGAMALIVQPTVAASDSPWQCLLPPGYLPTHETLAIKRRLPGMAVGQMMWIDFSRAPEGPQWEEGLLATFSSHTRRDIRSALRSQLTCFEAEHPDEIRAVYEVIEENGRTQGYATRTWQEFGETLVEQVKRRQAMLLGVRDGHRLVGAHYGVLAGRRVSYIMGGTVRTHGSLKVGHYTHWMVIKKARERGLMGYDMTSWGTPGVNRFKMGFSPEVVKLVPPQQYVFQPWRYRAWIKLLPTAQRHARFLASAASAIRRPGMLVRCRRAEAKPERSG